MFSKLSSPYVCIIMAVNTNKGFLKKGLSLVSVESCLFYIWNKILFKWGGGGFKKFRGVDLVFKLRFSANGKKSPSPTAGDCFPSKFSPLQVIEWS